MQNHFALFKLPEQFAMDRQALDTAYREIQRLVHPDRFVNAPASDKRAALQWASLANDAYQTLRNPLKRAAYLCSLNGFPLDAETSGPSMPPDFIFEQIEWREHLDNAKIDKDLGALETLGEHLRKRTAEQMTLIENALNNRQFSSAVQEVRKMMFLQKFAEEISFAFDALDKTDPT
ncbi:Fe-S protein assembly co-chaperone HscB [Oxalobacter vibrioformis]|uniref:Co-chaperone protein HscB homolog n=1 Tax=Oxalobacter vibrioformis TaxID=933080 RepID=A0A9E9LW06_9BURK|nr:Fe-S protein assembly co-chaperone HscB [Oxalobacter vibrioformis]WAW09311.1 Fe-S protein assembly co-chaperone HscB [Oxalobacter vibrioformis]